MALSSTFPDDFFQVFTVFVDISSIHTCHFSGMLRVSPVTKIGVLDGEHGKGFAVVSDEISRRRGLRQQRQGGRRRNCCDDICRQEGVRSFRQKVHKLFVSMAKKC